MITPLSFMHNGWFHLVKKVQNLYLHLQVDKSRHWEEIREADCRLILSFSKEKNRFPFNFLIGKIGMIYIPSSKLGIVPLEHDFVPGTNTPFEGDEPSLNYIFSST